MNFIEPLEARIAPASLTFADSDGDKVVITTSGPGTLTLNGNVAVTNGQLEFLDLTDAAFQGANVSIVATRDPVAGGDGRVNVGNISAFGNDLGTVMVDGDLGLLTAGSGTDPARGVTSLSVGSLGRLGTSTGAIFVIVSVMGKLGSLKVQGDVVGTEVVANSIGTVNIGGSLLGGVKDDSGSITATDRFGSVKIAGDIVGGSGMNSGAIHGTNILGTVTVGGSLLGGTGPDSGVISSSLGSVGSVKIGDSIEGGGATFTGRVFAKTILKSVTVGGSLLGGAFADSGQIHTDGALGPVKIAHDVIGGSAVRTGRVIGTAEVGSVTIGGSLRGGVVGLSGEIRSDAGDIGAVRIGGDVVGVASFSGVIFAQGTLAGVKIGGDLIGGPLFNSGEIFSGGAMGSVTIGGDLRGVGTRSGKIHSDTSLANVTIGGSLVGGSGEESGYLFSVNSIGRVKVGGDVVGGGAPRSGVISAQEDLVGVSIGGSLRGSSAGVTGSIFADAIGAVKIGGDIIGGDLSGAANIDASGSILASTRIGSVFVGGSIRPGVDAGSGSLIRNGTIRANEDLGAVTIKGSLVGTAHTDGDPGDGDFTLAIIAARGQNGLPSTAKSDVAIKSLFVGGRVEQAQILAGYLSTQFITPVNADAQIGKVVIGGDLIASSIIAGVTTPATYLGTIDDTKISGAGVKDNADAIGAISKIASIVIKGAVFGTPAKNDLPTFAIAAQQLGSLTIGGVKLPLKPGASSDPIGLANNLGATRGATTDGFDFHAFEVA